MLYECFVFTGYMHTSLHGDGVQEIFMAEINDEQNWKELNIHDKQIRGGVLLNQMI